MADVYMHARLVEELIKEVNNELDVSIAFLGSQGPDPLYYTGGAPSRKVADDIHRYRTRDFFTTMVNYVKEHNTKTTYSFLVGFISHYVMDIFLHPFVYYYTGVYDVQNPSTHHLRGLHLRFERTIDCLLIEKEQNIPSRKMNLTKKYFPLKEAPKEVCELMGHTLQKQYNIENGYALYEKSIKAVYKTLKYIVTDRFGIKKQLYKVVDFFQKGNDLFLQDLSLFKNTKEFDYHNDLKRIWQHPLTGEETTETVGELFDKAKEYALDILHQVDQYVNQNNPVNLENIFTDLSFNSGKECKYGMDFKFTNIYNK